jgi:prephenate dehydrogenase
VLDTCAVKAPVLAWADESLREGVSFVGGDPIVQAVTPDEVKSGADLGNADLFQNAMFCLCPSTRAQPAAVQLASDLVSTLGAHAYFLDASEHDGLTAGVEHLPALLGAALLLTTSDAPAWREMRKVAGENYRRVSQLPAGPAAALRDAALSNGTNLTRWIDEIVGQLETLRDAIKEGDEKRLDEMFEKAMIQRGRWMADRAKGFAGEDLPQPTEAPSYWKTMFGMGGLRRKDPNAKDEKGKR